MRQMGEAVIRSTHRDHDARVIQPLFSVLVLPSPEIGIGYHLTRQELSISAFGMAETRWMPTVILKSTATLDI